MLGLIAAIAFVGLGAAVAEGPPILDDPAAYNIALMPADDLSALDGLRNPVAFTVAEVDVSALPAVILAPHRMRRPATASNRLEFAHNLGLTRDPVPK